MFMIENIMQDNSEICTESKKVLRPGFHGSCLMWFFVCFLESVSIKICHLPNLAVLTIKIRRSHDHLTFMMGFSIHGKIIFTRKQSETSRVVMWFLVCFPFVSVSRVCLLPAAFCVAITKSNLRWGNPIRPVYTGILFAILRLLRTTVKSHPKLELLLYIITLLTHLPLGKMAAISQTTFSDAFSWMKSFLFWLKFHWSLFPRVQLKITQHWFR